MKKGKIRKVRKDKGQKRVQKQIDMATRRIYSVVAIVMGMDECDRKMALHMLFSNMEMPVVLGIMQEYLNGHGFELKLSTQKFLEAYVEEVVKGMKRGEK